MSYRILVEIGHEASIRTKLTPDGFTHDWEIFVRGCDADIQHYVEKVVFNLHHTFAKPKRVIKEPPYKVKESGYAGFHLLIEIYLKNSDEPKKITFNYDLQLQSSGPAIYKVQKEKYVFHHPNEEFRQRLLKGGATIVNTPSSHSESSREFPGASEERAQLVDKPKLGGDMTKKPKIRTEETKLANSFAALFGQPIKKTTKVSPEPKLQSIKNSPKNMSIKSEKNIAQPDKSSKSKHSQDKPERSKEKDHTKKNKEDRRNKEKTKERDKSKEKNAKRDKSPSHRPSASPRRSPKRESSPKKSSSPKRIASPSPKPKFEERNKYDESNLKDKEKQNNDVIKSDKKLKKDKKDKTKDREKDKREHKSHSKDDNKNDIDQKDTSKGVYKDNSIKPIKDANSVIKEKEQIKMKEKIIKPFEHPQSMSNRGESKDVDPKMAEKQKSVKHEISEKHKHKHKKKDREKSKKDEKERRHDKIKVDKISDASPKTIVNNEPSKILPVPNNEIEKENHLNKNNNTQPNMEVFAREEKSTREKSTINPLNTLIAELSDNESSDSSNNNSEIGVRNKVNSKSSNLTAEPPISKYVEPIKEFTPPIVAVPPKTVSKDIKNDSNERLEKTKKSKKHRDKHKSNKSPEKDIERKRKRKSSSKTDDNEATDKVSNDEMPRPTKQIKSEIIEDEKIDKMDVVQSTADYMSVLKELQHKIMTLQDNSELQRVVQLIAETGQYEITRQTFDFDLCALDRKTVDRLQEFFKAT